MGSSQHVNPSRPPADEAGRLQFQIRIPDGRRLKRAFRPEDSIGQVYAYACVEGGEALVTREFRLVETMPRRTYEAGRFRAYEPEGLRCFSRILFRGPSV
ncbi:unnamed protein product [Symbiodinium microadriaticum]|nr:unnamed protein product [Symbiodinium microadriaticum]CAE7949507.1 unnamed protein product [Symbiodinium sp. KB8]